MSSNFARLHKIINQAYAENYSCLFHVWSPEICQDAPNQVQDDLVLFTIIFFRSLVCLSVIFYSTKTIWLVKKFRIRSSEFVVPELVVGSGTCPWLDPVSKINPLLLLFLDLSLNEILHALEFICISILRNAVFAVEVRTVMIDVKNFIFVAFKVGRDMHTVFP